MATVARHDSPELSWEMVTRDADPRMRQHVRSYTGYVERTAEPLRRLEVPSGDVTLIISPDTRLSLPHVRDPSRPAARFSSFVAALHDTYALVDHDGSQHGIEVRLTPLGAHSLFGLPMDELTNRVVGLDDLGAGADELVGRLWDLPGWEPRFRLLDDLIGRRVEARRPSSSSCSGPGAGCARAEAGRASAASHASSAGATGV